ncbi:MAG: hypothetical protein V4479_16010 [Actinomycetota bacterium]
MVPKRKVTLTIAALVGAAMLVGGGSIGANAIGVLPGPPPVVNYDVAAQQIHSPDTQIPYYNARAWSSIPMDYDLTDAQDPLAPFVNAAVAMALKSAQALNSKTTTVGNQFHSDVNNSREWAYVNVKPNPDVPPLVYRRSDGVMAVVVPLFDSSAGTEFTPTVQWDGTFTGTSGNQPVVSKYSTFSVLYDVGAITPLDGYLTSSLNIMTERYMTSPWYGGWGRYTWMEVASSNTFYVERGAWNDFYAARDAYKLDAASGLSNPGHLSAAMGAEWVTTDYAENVACKKDATSDWCALAAAVATAFHDLGYVAKNLMN